MRADNGEDEKQIRCMLQSSNRSVEHLTVSFLVSAQNGMTAYGGMSFVLSIINRIGSNL